jgi:hypothetical protein
MPTLNWIGKDAVVKHHKDMPYRLLERVPALLAANPTANPIRFFCHAFVLFPCAYN